MLECWMDRPVSQLWLVQVCPEVFGQKGGADGTTRCLRRGSFFEALNEHGSRIGDYKNPDLGLTSTIWWF